MSLAPPWKLWGEPILESSLRAKLAEDFEGFAESGLPDNLEEYLLAEYRIDVSSSLAGLPLKNPWGKASGQLSMTVRQVEEDAESGLGFVVLKTVIAQDETGQRMMEAWAVKEAKMTAERIVGKESGRAGWTVSWKGRGWWQSLDDYLDLVRQAAAIGRQNRMPVIPSCKYHLPTPEEDTWKEEEYRYTTGRLVDAFADQSPDTPMPIEKDFSPTLAGSDRSSQKAKVLEWLATVPSLLRQTSPAPLLVGLKLFNALFEDEFQIEMLKRVLGADTRDRPDFITYANRLFDPHREYEGKVGIAYGGPDLSDRNLRVLDAYRALVATGEAPPLSIPISATGDIHSGRMAMEYALRGCTSFQLHTFFQLPAEAYPMRSGAKTAKALHLLYFHPTEGLIAWLRHLGQHCNRVEADGLVRFRDLVGVDLLEG